VKVGNSSRCCKFLFSFESTKGSTIFATGFQNREGVETGTSQKTCLCKINDFAAYGEWAGINNRRFNSYFSPAYITRCKIIIIV
jgi:hypothetical protein